jgi:hypothetical protein
LRRRAISQEDGVDLIVQKGAGVLIAGIKPIVVDQERLVLEPVRPTIDTDLLSDLLATGASEGRSCECGTLFAATPALNDFHVIPSFRRDELDWPFPLG